MTDKRESDDLKRIAEEVLELDGKATPGRWRREALGGCSTVLTVAEPPRADTRIPAYAYKPEKGYCIAYPFLYGEQEREVRYDFVSFGHDDAALIAHYRTSAVSLARAYLEGIEEKKRLTAERDASDAALLWIEDTTDWCEPPATPEVERAIEAARVRQRGEKK